MPLKNYEQKLLADVFLNILIFITKLMLNVLIKNNISNFMYLYFLWDNMVTF